MSPVEVALAVVFFVGALWVAILLTNDEWDRFGSWEYDEIERRERFEAAMKRHLAGGAE